MRRSFFFSESEGDEMQHDCSADREEGKNRGDEVHASHACAARQRLRRTMADHRGFACMMGASSWAHCGWQDARETERQTECMSMITPATNTEAQARDCAVVYSDKP